MARPKDLAIFYIYDYQFVMLASNTFHHKTP